MEAARSERPEGRTVEELLATEGIAKPMDNREDVQLPLRNMTILSDPIIGAVWPIKADEIKFLTAERPHLSFAGDISPTLMRTSHHAMAHDLANDISIVDVAVTYGLPVTLLRSLLQAPAFQDLMEEYRGKDKPAYNMDSKMEALAHDSMDEIRFRLEVGPEAFTTKQLMDISGDMLDRTGHSKVSRSIQLNGGLGGTDLEALKKAEPKLVGSKNTASEG